MLWCIKIREGSTQLSSDLLWWRGGLPAQLQGESGAAGSSSRPLPAGGLGGAPSRLGSKTSKGHTRASRVATASPADRYPEGNASQREYQMHGVRERGEKLLAELLARAELAEEQRLERDMAMEGASYID